MDADVNLKRINEAQLKKVRPVLSVFICVHPWLNFFVNVRMQHADERQVAIALGIIQTVADDK